jgi:hypothetical protein
MIVAARWHAIVVRGRRVSAEERLLCVSTAMHFDGLGGGLSTHRCVTARHHMCGCQFGRSQRPDSLGPQRSIKTAMAYQKGRGGQSPAGLPVTRELIVRA